jgi:hypothetical protein
VDQDRFAALTRQVAAASRRSAVRAMVVALGAAVFGGRGGAGTALAGICRFPNEPCSSKRQCCARKCEGGVCGCVAKGKSCLRSFGRTCCSGVCRRGKCR